ncbi:nitronate monooxygenase [Streptomyces durhamensis]|uniref:nitronate monooxygenase n=1 Tax=Streptomyces durhamensis TaxID=68194 RepID=UPI00068A9AAF|nr:nitronate monooxygenase [Streptomyces durhamensis]
MRTTVAQALGCEVSLLQSGMGGVAGPELACAVSDAGAAGCAGGYKLSGAPLSAMLERLVAHTARVVGVNLIPEVVGPGPLGRQVAQVLEQTPQRVYLSFFGLPPDAVLQRVVGAGRRVVVQVGTVEDGVRAAGLGAVVVAQGIEAGGHLLGEWRRDELVAALRSRLPDAVLAAAGGIGSPEQAGRALAAGADGVLLGTVFVAARESRAHPRFKAAVAGAEAGDTVISDVYEIGWPGRRHRVLATAVTADPGQPARFIGRTVVEGKPYLVPRFSAAVPTDATSGRIEEMALYCGLSCSAVAGEAAAADVVAAFAPVLADGTGATPTHPHTDPRTDTHPHADTHPHPHADLHPDPRTGTDPHLHPCTDPDTHPHAGTGTGMDPHLQPYTDPDPDTHAHADPHPHLGTDMRTHTDPRTGTHPHMGTGTDMDPHAGTGTHEGTHPHPHPHMDTDAHAGTDMDPHAGTGTHEGTHPHPHPHMGTDAHAGTHPHAHAGTGTHAHAGTGTDMDLDMERELSDAGR